MNQPLTQLGHLPVAEFIANYWQKKPLVIRQCFDPNMLTVTGDELASISLEPEAEARLVRGNAELGDWQLERGPFVEAVFANLPETDWTLLVQAVDQWLPDVNALLDCFRFIPDWRLDDIMISYAAPGGSVGPHFDQYDVFLLQGSGQRQWSVGDTCDHNTAKLKHPELQLLADFQARDNWILNPGDMLYLPPGIAHWGIAQQECVTYSIGFRAPTFSEAISSLADHLFENEANSKVFRDQLATVRANPAELTTADIDAYRVWLTEQLSDTALLTRWFGREATRSKYRNSDALDELDTSAVINWAADLQQTTLQRSFESRLAWTKVADSDDDAQLFADGNEWVISQALAYCLCERKQVTGKQLADCCRDNNDQLTVAQLLALGVLLS